MTHSPLAQRGALHHWGPLLGAVVVLVLDQVSKLLVVLHIPQGTVLWSFWDGFFRIIHVRNTGAAFSLGDGLPPLWRWLVLILIPLVFLVLVAVFYWKEKNLSPLQTWSLGLFLGGGAGNMIDRIFRPEGVVDFLDVYFFGIFGFERWPTFNVADSAVVVGGILLALSFFLQGRFPEKPGVEESET